MICTKCNQEMEDDGYYFGNDPDKLEFVCTNCSSLCAWCGIPIIDDDENTHNHNGDKICQDCYEETDEYKQDCDMAHADAMYEQERERRMGL